MSNILYNDINVFPASNSTTHGKITAEDNLRGIVTRLKTLNFVVEGLGLSVSGSNLNIAVGKCNIKGYLVSIVNQITIANYPSNKNVWFKLTFDNNDLLEADVDPLDTTKIEGVTVEFDDPVDPDDPCYLQIGKIKNDGTIDTTFTANPFPFSTNEIMSNDDPKKSLQEYLTGDVKNTYLSKVESDEKKGNVKFIGNPNDPADLKTITIDNDEIKIENNGNLLLSISEDIISGNASITLTVNGTNVVVQSNKVTIGDLEIDLSTAGTPTISSTTAITLTAPTVQINGQLEVSGTVRGSKVYNAVFN